MKRLSARVLSVAIAVTAVAETTPAAFADAARPAPASLEDMRANIRGEAMAAFADGDFQNVDRRWRGRRNYGGRRFYGPRRYYPPRRAYGPRNYYGPRRYYGRRYYYDRRRYDRPGLYFGIGI